MDKWVDKTVCKIKLIEDRFGLFKREQVRPNINYLYCGPMPISDVELWEARLDKLGTPYTLIQAEVQEQGESAKTGYCLLVDKRLMEVA